MNLCALEAAQEADLELNRLYRRLRERHKNTDADKRLVEAQKSWIVFRDKECGFIESLYAGASVAPMAHSHCVRQLTLHRIEELKISLSEKRYE